MYALFFYQYNVYFRSKKGAKFFIEFLVITFVVFSELLIIYGNRGNIFIKTILVISNRQWDKLVQFYIDKSETQFIDGNLWKKVGENYMTVSVCTLINDGEFFHVLTFPEGIPLNLLSNRIRLASDVKDSYEICLKSSDANPENKNLYLNINDDGHIVYNVITPKGEMVKNISTDIEVPKYFTLKKIDQLKSKVLGFSLKNSHTSLNKYDLCFMSGNKK